MKNKISHKFLLSIITVSSLVLLGACSTSSQKQTSETKPTVESSKVRSSSSKIKSSTKDSSKASSSSKQTKDSSNNASSNSNSLQNNNDASSSVASNNSQPSSPSSSQSTSNSPSTQEQPTKDSATTTPIDSGISISGSYQTTQQTPVKNSPSTNAPVEFYLDAGSNVNYDMKVVQDGHEWLSYISTSGIRRYVQADNNSVTTPVDSGTSVSGSYQTIQQNPVRNSPSVNAPIEFYLDPGSNVNYDMTVTEDGHEWLSYISSSGIRRYVQVN